MSCLYLKELTQIIIKKKTKNNSINNSKREKKKSDTILQLKNYLH